MTAQEIKTRRSAKIAFLASTAPEAEAALARLQVRYADVPADEADVIVALGGDGLMLQTLHRFIGVGKPIYGMNRGSVGFLMNDFRELGLLDRLEQAKPTTIHPLLMRVTDSAGGQQASRAINEVSLFR